MCGSTRNCSVWGGNKQARVVSPMQNWLLQWESQMSLYRRSQNNEWALWFPEECLGPFSVEKSKTGNTLLAFNWRVNHCALLHEHCSEKMKEAYVMEDVYVNRARETLYYSKSLWPVGKQLGNLFKQSWLVLWFAKLQLDVGWNNSMLSVTHSHRITEWLGLEGSTRDHLVQPPDQSSGS